MLPGTASPFELGSKAKQEIPHPAEKLANHYPLERQTVEVAPNLDQVQSSISPKDIIFFQKKSTPNELRSCWNYIFPMKLQSMAGPYSWFSTMNIFEILSGELLCNAYVEIKQSTEGSNTTTLPHSRRLPVSCHWVQAVDGKPELAYVVISIAFVTKTQS